MSSYQSFSGGSPESGPLGITGSTTSTIHALTGATATTGDDFVNTGGQPTSPLIRSGSDTLDSYDDPPNEEYDAPGTREYKTTLSNENTTAMMVANGLSLLPEFTASFQAGTPFAYRNVHQNQLAIDYQKTKFKFRWQQGTTAEQRYSLTFLVIFQPEDDPGTTEDESTKNAEVVKSIPWDGQTEESPEYTIDPETHKPGADGTYSLLPVEIEEVISDQFAGIEVNKLPSPYFGGVPSTADPNKPCEGGGGTSFSNNPMLMGCRSDGKAYLKASVYLGNIDAASVPDKLLVGLRVVDKDTRQPLESETRVAVKPLPSPVLTSMNFPPLAAGSDKLPFYEMVYGWDGNSDGKLQQTEVAGNFQKTPLVDSMGTPSTDHKQLVDLIHISSPTHIDYCVDEIGDFTFWQSYGMEYAEDLINAFIEGDKTEVTSNSHVTETTTTISAADPTELSHPVGLSFNSSGVATTHQFNFDKDSELSKDAYRSKGLETLLENLAIQKQTEIESAAPTLPGEHTYLLVEIPSRTGICFPGDYGDYSLDLPSYELRLFYGLKKAFIGGAVLFRINRYYNDASLTTQRVEVSWDEIDANVDDIYDFTYSTPQLPRQAVIIQSGFAGIGTKGKVCGVQAVLKDDPEPKRILIINL